MYAARDKSGTILLSEEKPIRMNCHWKSPTHEYMIMNQKYGDEIFSELKWENDPVLIACVINGIIV